MTDALRLARASRRRRMLREFRRLRAASCPWQQGIRQRRRNIPLMPRPRVRTALLAAAALAFALPAIAHAGPEECLDPSLDGAICALKTGGAVAQSVEGP